MARRTHEAQYETGETPVGITVQALGGLSGSQLGIKLVGILGPSIGGLVAAMQQDDPEAIMSAIREATNKMNPAEFKAILKEVIVGSQAQIGDEFVDVTLPWLDETFAGAPGSIYKLFFNACKVNFENFSKELGLNGLEKITAKLKEAALKGMTKAIQAKA